MSEETGCSCGKLRYNMVFACSGAADVGAIADGVARQLARDKSAMMCCTAAIAAQIPEIVEKARGASQIVAIDGCDKECAKTILRQGGFEKFACVQLGGLGMEKGKSPATEERVAFACEQATQLLAQ